MSCCRDSESEDVALYRKVDDVALALVRDPEKFLADLRHPVKGPKLERLAHALQTLLSRYESTP